MIERRSVLKLGAASVAGALVNVPIQAFGAVSGDSDSSLSRAIFDERFDESLAFADEMNRRGAITSGIRGDVAKLWYRDLRVQLRNNRLPLAGLTDRGTIFFLEELARDLNMRVVFRVDHVLAQPGYGRAMAGLLCRFSSSEARDTAAQKRTGPFSPKNRVALVSWLIA
jgi:hypothetical protein